MPQTIRKALDYVFLSIREYKLLENAEIQSEILSDIGLNLLFFGALVLGFALLMGLFMYYMRQTIIVMSRYIEYDMRNEMYTQYSSLDLKFFKTNKTGDLMSRISEDVSKVRMYLGPALLYFINLVSLFVIVIYSMLSVNVNLTFYTLIPLPVLSLSIYIVSSVINKKSTIIQQQLAVLNSQAQEVYSGIRVVKSYVKESQFLGYFTDESNEFKSKSMDLAKVNALFYPLMILLVSISTLTVLFVGGIQVSKGIISPGNIAEFIIYVGMLTWPITSLGWIASIVQQAAASQQRINEFMEIKPSIIDSNKNLQLDSFDIEFKNVSFTYPETGVEALKNVSFKLESGKKLAIIGRTASGKSTIAELLVRMYDVNEGEILIGGKNVKDISIENLRRKLAYVPQEVFLFSMSISENITFGINELVSEETIIKNANYASIHDDIAQLPKKYDTLVGERGVTLSGGQKQRISLARALIKNPEVIILDDCLSAVDANTENNIVEHFNDSLNNKTTLVITHRVHSQMNYDKILVVDDGKIVEFGNHQELLDKKSFYYELFTQQSYSKEGE